MPLRGSEVVRLLRLAAGEVEEASPVLDASRQLARRSDLLVVEDNPINRAVMLEMLNDLGCGADVAQDGVEALEAMAKRQYALVLMDCQMPRLDGYEATRRQRVREGAATRTPIVAVTAHAFAGERERALDAGMDDYLTKPITLKALSRALGQWLPPAEQGSDTEVILNPDVRRSPKVVELFTQLVPGQIDELALAVSADDAAAVKAHAHKLKGSCHAIGAPLMARTCQALEPFPPDAPALVAALRSQFEDLLPRLHAA